MVIVYIVDEYLVEDRVATEVHETDALLILHLYSETYLILSRVIWACLEFGLYLREKSPGFLINLYKCEGKLLPAGNRLASRCYLRGSPSNPEIAL